MSKQTVVDIEVKVCVVIYTTNSRTPSDVISTHPNPSSHLLSGLNTLVRQTGGLITR